MSRFQPCRDTDLVSVVRGCKCKCRGGGVKCCDEKSLTLGQVIKDPGFENFIALTGREEIAVRTFASAFSEQLLYDDLTYQQWKKGQWTAHGSGWDVLTDGGADTGSAYAKWSGSGTSPFLEAGQNRMCSEFRTGDPGSNPVDAEPHIHTGRVQSGNLIEVRFRAKGSGGGTLFADLEFWRPDGAFQNEADPITLSTTMPGSSYATFTFSGIVGGSSEPFWFFHFWVRRTGTGAATLSIDNVTITVTP